MDELIKTFHVDAKLLIAQMVNFAVVVLVLYKFAYKPLLKHMNERSDVIAKGLADAKKAQEQLENSEKEQEKRLLLAKKESKNILAKAQEQAEKNKSETVKEAKAETEKVVSQAKQKIHSEKEKMIKEVRKEIGALVMEATSKVVDEKMDDEKSKEMVKKAIKKL